MSTPNIYAVGDSSTISYATDSAATFIPLLGVVEFSLPKYVSPDVDTSEISVTADTSQGGRVKASDATLTLKFNLTQNQNLAAFQLAKTSLYWKNTLQTANTFGNGTQNCTQSFIGWIKEFGPAGEEAGPNKLLMNKLTLQISGTLSLA